ncbi:MAG: Clp protease ClpS [Crocinitomicaceae bacterium]|nr:Clp protease ClpS [Crocinitomicaceae bacterium]|tara:strand:+ start:1128 stop:1403 length:276 start_codon:yes stop_codon:yes gene_type:complete
MSQKHEYDYQTTEQIESVELKELMLFNDDFNTFQHVIEMLCKYCEHDSIQAEQCAWIVHNNGKCMVKRDEYTSLKPIYDALLDAGLSVKIL